jgi:hypothetical protein
LAVETKFIKLAVETKLRRLGVETTPGTEERYPAVPRPLTVEATWVSRYVVETKLAKLAVETRLVRLAVEIKFVRFAVDTKFIKLAVETKFIKLAVETTPGTDERYPAVPNPLTVDVRFRVVIPPTPLPAINAPFNKREALLTVKKFCVPKKGSIKFKEDRVTKPVLTRETPANPP